jgi:hypothetical protein
MRNKSFIAVHCGGLLTKEQHRILIKWARKCSEHVLPILGNNIDKRLISALDIAQEWTEDRATVSDARKVSVDAHAVARQSLDPVAKAIARSIGHAVATAHMADHSIGAALYAQKAVKYLGKSVEAERKWQIEQLSPEIKEIVLNLIEEKENHFKI